MGESCMAAQSDAGRARTEQHTWWPATQSPQSQSETGGPPASEPAGEGVDNERTTSGQQANNEKTEVCGEEDALLCQRQNPVREVPERGVKCTVDLQALGVSLLGVAAVGDPDVLALHAAHRKPAVSDSAQRRRKRSNHDRGTAR